MSVHNIGPKGCRRRIRQGSAIFIFSAVYLAILLILRPPAFFWLPVLISTFVGLLCLLQAMEKTCIVLAAKGVEMMDDSNRQRIQDNEIARKLRSKSTRLVIKAVMMWACMIVFYILVPK